MEKDANKKDVIVVHISEATAPIAKVMNFWVLFRALWTSALLLTEDSIFELSKYCEVWKSDIDYLENNMS